MGRQKTALIVIGGILGLVLLFGDFEASPASENLEPSPQQATTESPQLQEQNPATVVKVSDGDTIRVQYEGEEYPVRLIGIDTPEVNHPLEPVQCYGPEASQRLSELILNKQVRIEKDVSETDSFDRLLRYIWLGDQLINETMVLEGYAFSSTYEPDTKYQPLFNQAEVNAKVAKNGLWNENTCAGNVYTGTYKDPAKKVVPEPVYEEPASTGGYIAPTAPTYVPEPTPEPVSPYSCNCGKTCKQMSSCDEAYYQLNTCGCSARDGDKDGIPCESIC